MYFQVPPPQKPYSPFPRRRGLAIRASHVRPSLTKDWRPCEWLSQIAQRKKRNVRRTSAAALRCRIFFVRRRPRVRCSRGRRCDRTAETAVCWEQTNRRDTPPSRSGDAECRRTRSPSSALDRSALRQFTRTKACSIAARGLEFASCEHSLGGIRVSRTTAVQCSSCAANRRLFVTRQTQTERRSFTVSPQQMYTAVADC